MIDEKLRGDLRAANACRLRLADIDDEMVACLRFQGEMYRRADAFGAQFDELGEEARRLRTGLAKLERRLQRTGAYFVSEEQAAVLRTTISAVGADEAKFCHWWGVDSIPEIAAHEFDAAKAALESKRTKVAA